MHTASTNTGTRMHTNRSGKFLEAIVLKADKKSESPLFGSLVETIPNVAVESIKATKMRTNTWLGTAISGVTTSTKKNFLGTFSFCHCPELDGVHYPCPLFIIGFICCQ